MSTRAIVTAVNGGEKYSLYCHGDGYPAAVGRMVKNFCNLAPYIDVNNAKHGKKVWDSKQMSAYRYMANTSFEPSKFIPTLGAFMVQKGYSGIYLTDRDPIQEAKQGNTDIEWYYLVNMNNGNPKVRAFRMEYWGPPKPLYRDEAGKMHTIGSKQRFVEKKSLRWTELSNPILRINPKYRRPARYWPVPRAKYLIHAETSKPLSRKRAVRYGTPAMVGSNPVITDEEILAEADPALCKDPELQIAHDRMLLSTASPGSREYARLWRHYLAAGGNRSMIEFGIDNENWKRFRRKPADRFRR